MDLYFKVDSLELTGVRVKQKLTPRYDPIFLTDCTMATDQIVTPTQVRYLSNSCHCTASQKMGSYRGLSKAISDLVCSTCGFLDNVDRLGFPFDRWMVLHLCLFGCLVLLIFSISFVFFHLILRVVVFLNR